MSTFVIGDVHGCFDSLMRLLAVLDFDSDRDELWFVGDVVNRGPKSIEVLRYIRSLGKVATVVLGNHELHLLARAAGVAAAKPRDTFDDVLGADDCDQLIAWIRTWPCMVERGDDLLVHAGVMPTWTLADIRARSSELSAAIRGDAWHDVIASLVADRDTGLGAISAVFQRLRMLDQSHAFIPYSGPPRGGPAGAVPWFEVDHVRGDSSRVLFGHWSTLGLTLRDDAICLDNGCVWGRSLSAYNLESGTVTSVPSAE